MAHSVTIDDKLYEDLKSYCQLNGLKINAFCNKWITEGLMMAKYGDTPFTNYDEPVHDPYDSSSPYDEDSPADYTEEDTLSDDILPEDENMTISATTPETPAENDTNFAENHPEEQQKVNKPRKRKLA